MGGGQEINKGESGGIRGWFDTLREKYSYRDVYLSDKITDEEYCKGKNLDEPTKELRCQKREDLHLSVSLRFFRSEKVAALVKAILDVDVDDAKQLYEKIKNDYPVCITRDLQAAKKRLKDAARGTQRCGITASSGAKRLRKYGVWVQAAD